MAPTPSTTVLILGSLTLQRDEITYLQTQIGEQSDGGCAVVVVDTSQDTQAKETGTYAGDVLTPLLDAEEDVQGLSSAEFVEKAIEVCMPVVEGLVKGSKVQGVVAVGGGTAAALAASVVRRACPVGFPKLLVSTVASGDLRPSIDDTDVTVMYSVVDVRGLNSMLKRILANAAGAIVGMAMAYGRSASLERKAEEMRVAERKKVAVTMFDNTMPCVENIRKILTSTPHDASNFELYVFHATGSGGRAMERLIDEGQIDAVIDLTTTEIPDELCGGVLSAGPNRLESATKKGIPLVVSVGACDMVNFGPKHTVPTSVQGRNLSYHAPDVTLMRTNKGENVKIGNYISSKLKKHAADSQRIRVVLPKGGLSKLDRAKVEKPTTSSAPAEAQTQPPSDPVKGTTGEPWHDPEANTALFETIMTDLKGSGIEVFEYPDNVNDEAFAISICEHLLEVMGDDPRKYRLANARRRKWSFDHGSTIDKLRRRRSSVVVPNIE